MGVYNWAVVVLAACLILSDLMVLSQAADSETCSCSLLSMLEAR